MEYQNLDISFVDGHSEGGTPSRCYETAIRDILSPRHAGLFHEDEIHVGRQNRNVLLGEAVGRHFGQSIGDQEINDELEVGFPSGGLAKHDDHCNKSRNTSNDDNFLGFEI